MVVHAGGGKTMEGTRQEYAIQSLTCAPDDAGPVVATLLRAAPPPTTGKAVLYLHGFIDYYFHDHVAAAFVARRYDFWALDLRKYGRSLLPHQHPNACLNVNDYYEELGMTLEAMQAAGAQEITLLGHSTGGLLACLYAHEGAQRGAITRLVLNSPFFEFNEPALVRGAAGMMANMLAGPRPYVKLPKGLSPMYGESLHKSRRGEWDYNLAWKPIEGFPAYLGWVRAIRNAQQRLQQGLDLRIPILLLHSDKSAKAGSAWSEDFHTADAVLSVADMKKHGPGLGHNVTLVEIADGKHNLFLSRAAVREQALAATFAWMGRR